MPYILDENGNYVYQFDGWQYEGNFDANQLESLTKIKDAFASVAQFEAFMEAEVVKPISFIHVKADGKKETLDLTGPDAEKILKEHPYPFQEAGRPGNRGAHLLAFALKNHMTLSELQLLSENPRDPRCPDIQLRLDNARKNFYETACCDDIVVQKTNAVNFYLGHIEAYKNELDKIVRSPDSTVDKMAAFSKLSMAFQSVGVQTLGLGGQDDSAEKKYGLEIVRHVNARLETLHAGFTFENIYNLGGFGHHLAQNISTLSEEDGLPLTGFQPTEEQPYPVSTSGKSESSKTVSATRAAKAFNTIYEAFSKSGESVIDAIKTYTEEKSTSIHLSIKNTMPPSDYNINDPEDMEILRRDENARTDMRLNLQGDICPKPVPQASFKVAIGGLIHGAGSSLVSAKKEKLPEDREFKELTQAMLTGRQVMSNTHSSQDYKITAMRQIQICADQYIAKNRGNTAPMIQERVEQAKMAFSVATGERKVLEGVISPNRDKAYERQDMRMGMDARLPFLKNQVAHLTKAIEDVDPAYVRSSQAFRDTKKALNNLNKMCKGLEKSPSPDKMELLRKAFKSVSENAEIYVRQKSSEKNPSALGKKRLDFMKELSASVDDTYGLMSKAAGKKILTNGNAAKELTEYSNNLLKQAKGQPENKEIIAKAVAYGMVAAQIAETPDAVFNGLAVDKAMEKLAKEPAVKEKTASIISQAALEKKAPSIGPRV